MALFADILHKVPKVKYIGLVKGESERVTIFESMAPCSLTIHALGLWGRRVRDARVSMESREITARALLLC